MRSGYGVLYFSHKTALRKCGGVPKTPGALMSGVPLYSAKQLRPVLADNYRAGRVPADRFNVLMDWFKGAR